MKSYHCICHTCKIDCVISAPDSAPRLLTRTTTQRAGTTFNRISYHDIDVLEDSLVRVFSFYDESPHGEAIREARALLSKLWGWWKNHRDHNVIIADNTKMLECDVSGYSGECIEPH